MCLAFDFYSLKYSLRMRTEISVIDTEKWRTVFSTLAFLLTLRPILKRHFHFRAVGHGAKIGKKDLNIEYI